jgi:hypothetical protein
VTWVKLDDQLPDHPKIIAAGPAASWLFVAGLCFASRYLTDGHIPTHMLGHLTKQPKPGALAARLVELGLWGTVDDGWQVHDYTQYQRSREQIEDERRKASRRQSRKRHAVTSGEVTQPETETDPSKPLARLTTPPVPAPTSQAIRRINETERRIAEHEAIPIDREQNLAAARAARLTTRPPEDAA